MSDTRTLLYLLKVHNISTDVVQNELGYSYNVNCLTNNYYIMSE